VAVLFLLFGSVGLGFALIFLIGLTAPKKPKLDLIAASGGSPLVELDAEQLGKVVALLLAKMGLELDRASGGPGSDLLEIVAKNPAPVTGGTVLIHCIPAPSTTGTVDGPMVGKFIRAVRTAYVSKGLLFTTGTFTSEARLEAEDTPIELFDRDQLSQMIDQHLGGLRPEMLKV
jgi:restriction endonuclease Mrr